ncbi:MAG TPA: ATP-binding protein, partial [Candidatus Obscuribacter sp.]|nr:ATP-binding protein [Candidatus Obscuribacter sp.]
AQAVLALDRLCRGHNELAFLQAHAGRYQDELSVLERELVRLSEILAAQDRGHRQWVADTSHELRTPIAVLRAQVEAFQDGVQEVTARNLEVLHNEIMALSKLVDDLHWLAKYDVGQIKVSPSLTDVGAVLQDVVEALCERFEGKGLKIENTTGGAGKILANLDINRLRPVFTNLMENSLRYTDRGGILKISAESDGKELSLRFDDSAPGVSDEVLGRMFERFFRAESSRNRTLGGSGLGLAICKNNMQMLGGTIEASHSPLGGVRIELKMPLNLPPDVPGTRVLDNSREATTNTVAAGSEVNQPDRAEDAVQDVRE